jgi:gas vesicle protein
MKTPKNNHVVGKTLVVGAGIAAASVAAVLLFGSNGKKNRKDLKDWSMKMKKEVVAKAKELKVVSAPVYAKIVSQVAAKYATAQDIGKDEFAKEIKILKDSWHSVVKNATKKPIAKKGKAKGKTR